MFDNPVIRLISRSLLAGLGSFLSILYATGYENMDTADWINAAVAGLLVALSFSGISAATPIDQSIGATNKGGGK